MKNCMITFRSVTPAQRAESMLRRMGFTCALQRTPRWMEQQGCGYSLQIPHHQTEAAVAALRTKEIAFRKIYLLLGNGRVEELEL